MGKRIQLTKTNPLTNHQQTSSGNICEISGMRNVRFVTVFHIFKQLMQQNTSQDNKSLSCSKILSSTMLT